MKVEGLDAVRDNDSGAIVFNNRPRKKEVNAKDKYIQRLEKRITRLENLVNKHIKETKCQHIQHY